MIKLKTDGKIQSITDALEVIKSLKQSSFIIDGWPFHKFPFGLWFRGQSKRKPLEPHVFRKVVPLTHEKRIAFKHYDETNLFEHLKLRVPQYHQIYRCAFDWLCLMQHYSLPTRLLDWSESILPALYFAVRDHREEDGEVVVLNARRLNGSIKERPTISTAENPAVIIRSEMAGTRSAKSLRLQNAVIDAARIMDLELDEKGAWMNLFTKPLAVFPSRLNDRMVFQASVFTLHGGKIYVEGMKDYYKDDTIPNPELLENIDGKLNILKRYIIPRAKKLEIQENLFILGIHEGTLFPEIDRQSIYLGELWSYPTPKRKIERKEA